MSNTITHLRDTLFDTLQRLKDKDNPMEIDRAIAITKVAGVIVDTAKVEVDHMRITGGTGSGFIPAQSVDRTRPQLPGETYTEKTGAGNKTVTMLPGGATVTTHKMRG
jgi:hypothetical protein